MTISNIGKRLLLASAVALASFAAPLCANDSESNSSSGTAGSASSSSATAITVNDDDAAIKAQIAAIPMVNPHEIGDANAEPVMAEEPVEEATKETRLFDAVVDGDKNAVVTQLEAGANPNAAVKGYGANSSVKLSAMFMLTFFFDEAIANQLLAHGGDKNTVHPLNGKTMLQKAREHELNGAIAYFEANGFPE